MNDYLEKVRAFGRNARLYVLHVIGMDMIHGTWGVLFNLYLLAIGLPIEFIGLRILVGGIAGAFASIPAGIVSDRIGRKASFVMGDGVGAMLGLVNIMSTNRNLLLSTAALGSFFGALHAVSEPPFMHENSKPAERVHLFSVADSLRTASAMVGSLLAGFLPLWAAARIGQVSAYRAATFVGLGLWFLSLIPALLLREETSERAPSPQRKGFLSGLEHPELVARLVTPGAIAAFGAGLTLPLANVFFHEGLHAGHAHIGSTFAAGQLFVAIAALLAPLLVARMSKVSAVVATRALAVPFALIVALAASRTGAAWAFPLAAFAWVGRSTFMGASSPIEDAFSMQVLSMRERATMAGIEAALWSGLMASGAFFGSRLMAGGDYATPFVLLAVMSAVSVCAYWLLLRPVERGTPVAEPVPVPV